MGLGHGAAVATGSFRPRPAATPMAETWRAIPVTRIPARPEEQFTGDRGSERIAAAVVQAAEDFGAGICHVHHWFHLSNDLVRRLKEKGHKVVVTLHDLYATCPRLFRQRDRGRVCAPAQPLSECAACVQPALGQGHALESIEQGLIARHDAYRDELAAADMVLTPSAFLRDVIQGVPALRAQDIRVLPLGITRRELRPVSPPAPVAGQLRLLHFAGIDELKGIGLILDAIARTRAPESFQLILYGREARPGLVRHFRGQHPSLRMEHRGAFESDAALMAAASTADLAVMPSELPESYGLVADEAMAMGLPLIVGELGAPLERIQGRGWGVSIQDPGAMASLLDRLRTQPGELTAMRQQSSAAPPTHRFSEHCNRVLRIYDDISG